MLKFIVFICKFTNFFIASKFTILYLYKEGNGLYLELYNIDKWSIGDDLFSKAFSTGMMKAQNIIKNYLIIILMTLISAIMLRGWH